MKGTNSLAQIAALSLVLAAGWGAAAPSPRAAERRIPSPLPDHPGNIFLEGEQVRIPLPPGGGRVWRLENYEGEALREVERSGKEVDLGRLGVGFYRLRPAGETNKEWTSLGVLAPLTSPTPKSSPVALDVAMSWFYSVDKMPAVASLCALAGVNRVRDRLNWVQMEPKRGQFVATNHYDTAAYVQAQAGLQVLQVIHHSPDWANPVGKRFPLDLRDAHRFFREMAWRWRGRMVAMEPWNEADIPMFGGHTGSEMAALQKAAYLGLKAWNPELTVCLNVPATHRDTTLTDLHDNEAWPYFDTFNLHHYEGFDRYPKLYADFRKVSAGRPLWVSECAVPVKWAGDDRLKEPTDADLRVQAERVVKTFALSIHEGSVATFYFMLPHYVEGQTQFGIIRPDLTPRPAYLALAAVGKLMADARPAGRLKGAEEQQAYCYHTKADGENRDLLVAWQDKGESVLNLPAGVLAMYDHLGRRRNSEAGLRLGRAPVLVLLPAGATRKMELASPPSPPKRLTGKASPIVLQAVWPEPQVLVDSSAYAVAADKVERIPIWVYNFSGSNVSGRLQVSGPPGWNVNLPGTVELPPDERKELLLAVDGRDVRAASGGKVRVEGDFGRAGHAVLSVRLARQGGTVLRELPETTATERWEMAVSGGVKPSLRRQEGSVVVEAEPAGSDRWIYPSLKLKPYEHAPADAEGLAISLTLLEGVGRFRAIFVEENGSAYVAEFKPAPRRGAAVEVIASFQGAAAGQEWAKPDPNHQLDPDQIRVVKIGANTEPGKVKFTLKHLRWVKQ